MCRFIAYMGNPILMDEILLKPNHSLIKQSKEAREMDSPLNGDGFGIGWYAQDIDPVPAVFLSVQPAWNDINLLNLVPKIRSSCFFAHLRAANVGGVSKFNCHPFHFDKFLFMHNGFVGNFSAIKRHMRRQLTDDIYDWIKGQTDSEHMSALFLELFRENNANFTTEDIAATLEETIARVRYLQGKYGQQSLTYINMVVSDGNRLVAVRYTSELPGANTLYVSNSKNQQQDAVLVVSEKLSSAEREWQEVPVNHLLMIEPDLEISLRTLQAV